MIDVRRSLKRIALDGNTSWGQLVFRTSTYKASHLMTICDKLRNEPAANVTCTARYEDRPIVVHGLSSRADEFFA